MLLKLFRKARWVASSRVAPASETSAFHFVKDYERFVQQLVNIYPIDEAMERAVGGRYEAIGII